ncbi:MAG TPA: thiamine pyrophosphate-binding protein [Caulobacterales bacterium]|nr:thiamine pyrophosphate-binding protein [Caulobacterales bacterium]
MAAQTVTEAIVARLAAAGVTHIFGVPGGECNLDFIAAADKLGVKFVLTRNETAASIMACVASELTGAPGVAMTTRGPGLAAAANGACYSYLDRAAMLLIADGYEDDQNFISHQRIDQAAMLAPVTKASSLLRGADPLAEVEALLERAQAQPPGPVYLEVAGSHIRKPAPPTAPRPQAPQPPSPDAAAFARAKELLAQAKRPMIIAGLQAREPAAAAALRAFVAKRHWPVLTTYKAKGVVSDHEPRLLGHYMGGVAEESAVRSADLLLLYGNDPVEGPPQRWKYDAIPSIELTQHAFEFPLYTATTSIVGDIAASLAVVDASAPRMQWTAELLADMKHAIQTAARVPMSKTGVSPQQIIDAAAAALPADCRITIDAGAHMLPVLHLWKSAEPRQSLISRGLSTMGFAVPAAVASCLVDPKRRTVAFTGDGGLMMCLGELGTAQQEGVAPIVVVFNDSSLTLIGAKQRRRQLAPAGVDFYDTDFAQMARGFGWDAHRVTNSADLAGAFASAAASNRATLIDVVIDPGEYDAQILALRG